MAPSGTSPHSRRGEDPSRASGAYHIIEPDGSSGPSTRCCAQVQRDISDHSGSAQHGQVHAGDRAQGEGSGGCLDRARGPARTGSPTGCGDATSSRWTTTIEFSRGPPEDAERVVRGMYRPMASAGLSTWLERSISCCAYATGQTLLWGRRSKQRSLGDCDLPASFSSCFWPRPYNLPSHILGMLDHCSSWSPNQCWTLHLIVTGAGRPAQEQILRNR